MKQKDADDELALRDGMVGHTGACQAPDDQEDEDSEEGDQRADDASLWRQEFLGRINLDCNLFRGGHAMTIFGGTDSEAR